MYCIEVIRSPDERIDDIFLCIPTNDVIYVYDVNDNNKK